MTVLPHKTLVLIPPTFGFPANNQTVQNIRQYFDAAAGKLNIAPTTLRCNPHVTSLNTTNISVQSTSLTFFKNKATCFGYKTTTVIRPELKDIINPLVVSYKTGLMMAVIFKPKRVAVPLINICCVD